MMWRLTLTRPSPSPGSSHNESSSPLDVVGFFLNGIVSSAMGTFSWASHRKAAAVLIPSNPEPPLLLSPRTLVVELLRCCWRRQLRVPYAIADRLPVDDLEDRLALAPEARVHRRGF